MNKVTKVIGRLAFLWPAAAVLLLLAAGPAVALNLVEGEWEHVSVMEIEGMPFPVPPTTMTECIGKGNLVPDKDDGNNCEISERTSGNTVHWQGVCKEDGTKSKINGEITYAGKTYKGSTRIVHTDAGGETSTITMKLSGRYLGPCTGKKPTVNGRSQNELAKMDLQFEAAQRAQAEQQKRNEETQRRGAAIAAMTIPAEDPGACLFSAQEPEQNRDCAQRFGALALQEGKWETVSQTATRQFGKFVVVDEERQEQECLSVTRPLAGIQTYIDCSPEEVTFKRSGDKLTWAYRCAPPGGGSTEGRGGVVFRGDRYEGGLTQSRIWAAGQEPTVTFQRLSGRRLADGSCVGRAYTAKGRDYTAKKRTGEAQDSSQSVKDSVKDAVDNPAKSIRRLFGL